MYKIIIKLFIGFSIISLITACDSKTSETKDVLKQITVAQWGQEKYLIYLPLR